MVDTIKFSQMTAGGDIANNDTFPGLLGGGNVLFDIPWTFLPPGSTAQRPAPSAAINYRLRFNTDDQLYEYYDAILSQWITIQESGFTTGPYITYTADAALPDAQNLGLLASGILKQTVTTGTATLNIAANGVDYYGPGFAGYFQAPAGVEDVNGNIVLQFTGNVGAVNYLGVGNALTGNAPTIYANGTDTNIPISLVSKGTAGVSTFTTGNTAFQFFTGSGYQHDTNFVFPNSANSVNVTFQDSSGTVAYLSNIPSGSPSALTEVNDTNVTLTLGGTPETALLQAVSITAGWTGQLSPARGGTGVNNGTNTLTLAGSLATSGAFSSTFTMTGATNVTFPTSGTLATTAGTVSSVSGTANQIGSTGGTTPVISIANNPVIPGSAGITLPSGNTAARAGGAGTIRFNSQTTVFESTIDGSNWATIETSSSGFSSVVIQQFTANGTYTPTTGMKYCIVECVGGGGGGGGVATTSAIQTAAGGGGGAGEYARTVFTAATIGASKAVAIGAAGTAGDNTGGNGGAGGNTTLGSTLIIAVGGSGGTGMAAQGSAAAAAGGAGGTGGTGTLLVDGGVGMSSIAVYNATVYNVQGGAGGNSFFGQGGPSVLRIAISGGTATGSAANGFGSGGGGAANSISAGAGAAGSVGNAGYMVITEYC